MADQCTYMRAAYPDLDADDTCHLLHRHEPRVFALAKAFAEVFQGSGPSDEQVAWFLNDADAVVDDFPTDTAEWLVEGRVAASDDPRGLDWLMTINGVAYVLPSSEWEPATPVSRTEWDSWHEEDE